MWKWTCPASPKVIWEHHSEESARQSMGIHVIVGSPTHGLVPCTLVHELVDDGVPCGMDNCRILYKRKAIRSSERR
jgi:hypothetical protein